MLTRLFLRFSAAALLLGALWGLSNANEPNFLWPIQPVGAPRGPVRITRFYATSGIILAGQKAKLCYGVENARSVLISPPMAIVIPAANRCLDVVPLHTTHYTIMAEGYDGRTAARFATLVVETQPVVPRDSFDLVD